MGFGEAPKEKRLHVQLLMLKSSSPSAGFTIFSQTVPTAATHLLVTMSDPEVAR
jgi:hypothetical protein